MPTTYVIFRHANDKVKTVHKQDPPITKSGKKEARRTARRFIDKYGFPNEIRISPFRRTRETYEAFQKELGEYESVYVDINLSRYFSKKERKNPKVSEDTFYYDIPIDEDMKDFKDRVRSYAKSLKSYDGDKVIWIITHALVFKEIADYFKIDVPDNIDFLHHFKIEL